MSKVANKSPCPKCGSRDNLIVFVDGGHHCFTPGCRNHYDPRRDGDPDAPPPPEWRAIHLPELEAFVSKRGISQATLEKYGVGLLGDNLVFPHYERVANQWVPVRLKFRDRNKNFWYLPKDTKSVNLWGKQVGGARQRLIITEGEFDALSYKEAFGSRATVVSLPNGSQSHRALVEDIEWISSFDRVYLSADMDTAGQALVAKALEILPPGRTYEVRLGRKDANEVLVKDGPEALQEAVRNARCDEPDGFVDDDEILSRVISFYRNDHKSHGISTGFAPLDAMVGGWRPGELVVLTSGTGVGKSSVARALMAYLVKEENPVLYFPCEDLPEVTPLQILGILQGRNLIRHRVDPDEIQPDLAKVVRYFKQIVKVPTGGTGEVLDTIRWGCLKYAPALVVIDHITGLAQLIGNGDTRDRLVSLTWGLANLAKELGVPMLVVSHVSRDTSDKDDTKPTLNRLYGSQAIAQGASCVIGLSKDSRKSLDTRLHLLKLSRLWGYPETTECVVRYDPETTRIEMLEGLNERESEDFEEDENYEDRGDGDW